MAIYRRDGYGSPEFTIAQYDSLIAHYRREFNSALSACKWYRAAGQEHSIYYLTELKNLSLFRRLLTHCTIDRNWVMSNPYGVGHSPDGEEY